MTQQINGHPPKLAIQDASAWILRGGVVASVLFMLVGTVITFSEDRISIQRMRSDPFVANPVQIIHDFHDHPGRSTIEIGICLLVLTPVARVAMSIILFALEDRDWIYTLITATVLLLTLAGLLWFR